MPDRRQSMSAMLPHLLLAATVVELAVYRLAVPALEPALNPGVALPLWHRVLGYAGLFLFYFASVFSIAVLAHQLRDVVRHGRSYALPLRVAFALAAAVFGVVAISSVLSTPTETVSFALEASFAAAVVFLVVAQAAERGDLGVRLGLVFLALPLVVHFYGQFSVQFIAGEEGLWNGLLDDVDRFGRWTLLLAALSTPYCLAPRPFLESAGRLAPVVVSAFVGLVGALVMRHDYEVGVELAAKGLGVQLGPGAPASLIALYILALSAVTWTLVACLTAPSAARRSIGVGLGLVVAGGYAFSWPLQFLVGLVGLVTIGRAARPVVDEESAAARTEASRFRSPPIGDAVWQRFTAAVVERLRADTADDAEPEGATATVRGDDGALRTYLVARRADVDLKITVERVPGGDDDAAIVAFEIVCGDAEPGDAEPDWTLYARGERRLGTVHPPPPHSSARAIRTGDPSFDQRFQVRDRGGLCDRLLDDGLRAQVTGAIDGWMAFWPATGRLVYRVHPGRGAPLDHPIPITELAFRGAVGELDRLMAVIDLVAEIGARGRAQ